MRTTVATRLISLMALLVSMPIYAYNFELDGYDYIKEESVLYKNEEIGIGPNYQENENNYYFNMLKQNFTIDERGGNISVIAQTNMTAFDIWPPEDSWAKLGQLEFFTDLFAVTQHVDVEPFKNKAPSRTTSMYMHDKTITITQYRNFYINESNFSMLRQESKPLSVYTYDCDGVVWSSSDESVATVDANGLVKGVGVGTVTITATSSNGKYKDSISVTIEKSDFEFTVDGINYYGEINSTIVEVTGISQSLANVTIPESVFYNGISYRVTSIGKFAFYQNKSIISVSIPGTICSIGSSAFEDCTNLTSVTIPNSVTSIGVYAFGECSSLSSIVSEIKNPFEISNDIFYSRHKDIYASATLTVHAGTKLLYQSTAGWNKFQNIVEASEGGEIGEEFMSDGLYYRIGESNTVSVTSRNRNLIGGDIVIPYQVNYNGIAYLVTSIEDNAFNVSPVSDPYTKSVTIPSSITSIGEDAFSDRIGLTAVYISDLEAWCNIQFHGEDSNPLFYANHLFLNSIEIKDLVIPNSVTSISDGAFMGGSSFTSITIPASVTRIGSSAFRGCSSLNAVNITDLEAWCKISFNDSNPLMYAHHLFMNGTETTELNIPKSITRIKSHSFNGCSGLTSVTIPDNVTSIGDYAFANCNSLTSVILEIKNPFAIGGTIFSSTENNKNIYATATLTVPAGTKSLYQSTSGWNRFQNIIEVGGVGYKFESDGLYYRIGENNTVSVIAYGGSEDNYKYYYGDVVIPSQVTYNGTTYSVTKIGNCAFWYCSNLTSITIPNSVNYIGEDAFKDCNNLTAVHISDLEAWLKVKIAEGNLSLGGDASVDCSSSPLYYAHHLYLNGKEVRHLEIPNTITKINNHCCDGWSGLLSVTIPNSVTSIGYEAFLDCNGLNSVTIPNSVKSIEGWAFGNCSSLTSLSLGSGLDRIDYCSFIGCSSLISIVSEIMNPFEFSENVFDTDIYTTAILTVPAGTKTHYQSTAGWNKFKNIVEESTDDANFTINGVTYQGTKSSKTVIVTSVDKSLTSLEIPASVSHDGVSYHVTGIADDAFIGCSMGALIWNVDAALPNNAFSNSSIGSNFLLYVKAAAYAPSSIKNVIANGTAQTIVLSDDGGLFYCPQTFTARSISYTHNYSMETGGNGKGWETIALPFDVQRIVHSTRGEIVPFAGYSSASSQKPFWLGNMSASGFKRTSSILANEPYIISMPNNSKYKNEYNLAGDVTFSAENVQVPKTPIFNGLFLPAFSAVAKSSMVYALNVSNRYVKYSGNYDAGSRFISNLRDIRPFEAYISDSSTRGIFEINLDAGMTDIEDILIYVEKDGDITIYTLSGQQISRTTQNDFGQVWQQLHKGVYIVNGKKMIK